MTIEYHAQQGTEHHRWFFIYFFIYNLLTFFYWKPIHRAHQKWEQHDTCQQDLGKQKPWSGLPLQSGLTWTPCRCKQTNFTTPYHGPWHFLADQWTHSNTTYWRQQCTRPCDHFIIHTEIKSLCYTPESKTFYVNYTSIIFELIKRKFNKTSVEGATHCQIW